MPHDPRPKIITRAIWIISLVSLFTDVAGEMLYPILPLYLKEIGFSIVLIGVLEGVAEATAGLSKGYFGRLSDVWGVRLPFVRAGYTLSAISKPLLAIFPTPLWVFFARTLDRFGKGLRTGARDALLSDETTPEHKGRVFGFHRSLDTMGAFIGPLIALAYMYAYPGKYATLFYYAIIPGVVAVALTFLLTERRAHRAQPGTRAGFLASLSYVRVSPPAYRRLLFGMLAFALFNSSDIFLLLMVKQSGASDTTVIGMYVWYNVVYAALGYPVGVLGDKIGLQRTFVLGATLFAAVYAGMAFSADMIAFAILFFLYGVFAAANEGIVKAWISNVCAKADTATAIGTYAGFNSIFALLASGLAGFLWMTWGPAATFLATAVGVVCVVIYFSVAPMRGDKMG